MNVTALTGRLVHDPELNVVGENKDIAKTRFTLAVDRDYNRDQTDFINCVAWRGTARFIDQYFHKGKEIAVVGSIQTRKYTTSDGTTKWVTEVVVEKASFCGSKAGTGASPEEGVDDSPESKSPSEDVLEDDELPF